MKKQWRILWLVTMMVGFAASGAGAEGKASPTLAPVDQDNHIDFLKQMTAGQVTALSAVYPDFRVLKLCSGRFSGADRDELVLGVWKPQASDKWWKHEVHRVGLIWKEERWEVHVIDDEIEKDEALSRSFPMKWQYAFAPSGFSGEMRCGLPSGIEGDPDLTYRLGDRPFFDLGKKRLSNNKVVCFATDDVYNNWDCVVYSPEDGRFRLWFQQAHAD